MENTNNRQYQKVEARDFGPKGAIEFFASIEKLQEEGWKFCLDETSSPFSRYPRFQPRPIVFLYKEMTLNAEKPEEVRNILPETEGEKEGTKAEEHVEAGEEDKTNPLPNKGEEERERLLALAREHGIEIPSHIKKVSALKKFMKEALADNLVKEVD